MLLLLATPLSAAETFVNTHGGLWHGVGIQVDGQEWPMELQLEPGHVLVEYPTLDCGGYWTGLRNNKDLMLAIEHITHGITECLDGGLVRLKEYGDSALIYRWYDNNGTPVAAAVLVIGPMLAKEYDALRALTLEGAGKGFIKGPDGATDVSVGEQKT